MDGRRLYTAQFVQLRDSTNASRDACHPRCFCGVWRRCATGLADGILDAVWGVTASRLLGCQSRVTVYKRSSSNNAARRYNFSRVHSELFRFDEPLAAADRRGREHPWADDVVVGHPCGIKDLAWLARQTGRRATVAARLELRHVMRSVHVERCPVATTSTDTLSRIGVHARRGDKLVANSFWRARPQAHRWRTHALYTEVEAWLRRAGHMRLFLASDDRIFMRKWAAELTSRGFDVATSSPAADPWDDLCALAATRLVVRASANSQFTTLAALLGAGRLVAFNESSGVVAKLLRIFVRPGEEAGLLEIKKVVPAPSPSLPVSLRADR
jgi:hypothetical protein